VDLMAQNTRLTELTNELSKRIETLTAEMHARVVPPPAPPAPDRTSGAPGCSPSANPIGSTG
jgi:hypothetical protein